MLAVDALLSAYCDMVQYYEIGGTTTVQLKAAEHQLVRSII